MKERIKKRVLGFLLYNNQVLFSYHSYINLIFTFLPFSLFSLTF